MSLLGRGGVHTEIIMGLYYPEITFASTPFSLGQRPLPFLGGTLLTVSAPPLESEEVEALQGKLIKNGLKTQAKSLQISNAGEDVPLESDSVDITSLDSSSVELFGLLKITDGEVLWGVPVFVQ